MAVCAHYFASINQNNVSILKYADDDTLRDEVKEGKVALAVYSHARKALPGMVW